MSESSSRAKSASSRASAKASRGPAAARDAAGDARGEVESRTHDTDLEDTDFEDADLEDVDADGEEDGDVAVAPDLDFTSTKKGRPADGDEEKIPFRVDGEIYYSVKPTEEALVFLTTASSRGLSHGDRFHALLQFVDDALDDDSSNRITQRFLDRDDDFGFEDLLEITRSLAKTWGRRKGGKTAARDRRAAPASRR